MSNNINLREQSAVVLLSLLMFKSAASGIYWMTWHESFHCLVICSLELVGNILIKGTRTTRANKQRAERQRDQFADFGGLHLNTLFESPQPDECFSIYWYWSRIPENIGKLLRTPGEFNEEEEWKELQKLAGSNEFSADWKLRPFDWQGCEFDYKQGRGGTISATLNRCFGNPGMFVEFK